MTATGPARTTIATAATPRRVPLLETIELTPRTIAASPTAAAASQVLSATMNCGPKDSPESVADNTAATSARAKEPILTPIATMPRPRRRCLMTLRETSERRTTDGRHAALKPDELDDGPDSPEAERHREAIVEMANLTNGMMGGIFDRARGSSGVLGLSRPHSTAIWRVRVVSAIDGIVLAVLTFGSPLILALTIGPSAGVTFGLGAAAAAAGITFASTYAAKRREIIRRASREDGEREADPPRAQG